jgi:ABC-2 type transport system permease protein
MEATPETSPAPGAPPIGSVERQPPLWRFIVQTAAVVDVELRKLVRDPTEIFTRAVQPLLWLLVFGQVFGRMRGLSTGSLSYTAFLAPGILAQSVLFTGIFYGIAIIWERDLGILHKMLVSPAYRSALVSGKALAAGARGLAQGFVIYSLAALIGVPLLLNPFALAMGMLFIILGAAVFATLSLVVACLVKTRERFMGIGQLLTMPLFFASNAIYPLELMPRWLQVTTFCNPVTYLVDGLRRVMVAGGQSSFGLGTDMLVLLGTLVLLVAVGSRLYPRVVV